uniref:DnaJ homolog subfamily C member 17 n=1 Tax=Macaca nemestrina TaxID=9545 RepID=A0A2K6CPJ2_MACNE
MAVTKELLQMDLYALLGIEQTATDKEVKKAYRQKALSCHPDKNPDNPRAAELFPQLSRALEVLTDATARVTYDKVRKARKQAAETTQKLNDRRKRVRLELEAREQQAQAQRSEDAEGSRNPRTLEQEIQRLPPVAEPGDGCLDFRDLLMPPVSRLQRCWELQAWSHRPAPANFFLQNL